MAIGRVLQRQGDRADVLLPDGEVRRVQCAAAVRVGDLVRVEGERARCVARNRLRRPIEEQEWWRLRRAVAALRRRTEVLDAVRALFRAEGFLEVPTPRITAEPCPEAHIEPVAAGGRWLVTSPELHLKRILATGVERIYQVGPVFRADESGPLHRLEFTMLEWYRVDGTVAHLMRDVERLVEAATGRPRRWEVFTVAEALERWSRPATDPEEVLRRLVEDVEPRLAEREGVFLVEWPAPLAALARLDPERPEVAQRVEAYVEGIELANGFCELVDPGEQRARFARERLSRASSGRPPLPMPERFLAALEAGLPPCAGMALGIDRLVMLACGARHIDEVVPRLEPD